MDDLNIRITALLNQATSTTNIKKQTKQIEETLAKTPIQMRIEANTGIAMQEMSKSAKAYQQIWEKAFYNQKQQAIKNANEIKNAYNSQLFQNFNKSIGIGHSTGITEANSALKQYYENVNKLNKVSTIPTSEVIENTFSSKNTNKITKQNSALAELFEKSSKSTIGMSNLEKQVVKLNPAMANLNETTEKSAQSFSSVLAKIGLWGLATTAIYAPIRAFREGVETLKELDTQLVEINKVTDLSAIAMERLAKESFSVASAFGRTSSDYLSGVAEFSRAGYDGQRAENLSQIALLSQNVGELTSEQADQFLLATDAAYKYNGSQEQLMKVLDGMNAIDNQYATSILKISDGLTVAGSIASNAGVSIDELSSAIGTMTAKTQKSGREMGNAYRGIIMNLRQVKGGIDNGEVIDDESISKSAKALANVGIQVHELRNGIEELRNPMDIIGELSKKWKDLSTVDQSKIIEAIGGKYRGNALVALVEGFDQYQSMLTTYANSSGSAMRENEIRMESWQSKANQLKNTISEFWYDTLDTNTFKNMIDSANGLIKTLDDLVNNPMTKFITVAGLGALSGKTLALTFTALGKTTIAYEGYCIATALAEEGLIASTKMLTATLLASPLFLGALAVSAMYGFAKLIDHVTVSFAEQKKMVEDLTSEVSSLQSEYDQLSNKNFLTDEEQKKLEILEQQLKTKKELLELEQKEEGKKYVEEYTQLTDGFSGFRQIDKNNIEIEKYKNNLEELKDIQSQIDKETNANKKESLQNSYDKLSIKVKQAETSFQELYNTMTDEKSQGAEFTSNMEEQYNVLSLLINAMKESSDGNVVLANSFGLVSDALEKVTEKKALTKKETDQLVTLYPELANVVNETSDGFYIEANALSNLSDTARQSAISQINTQITLTKNVIEQTQKRISAMQLEAQAQQKIANIKAGSNSIFEQYASKITGKNVKIPTDSNVNAIAQDNLDSLENLLTKLNGINSGGTSSNGIVSSGDKNKSSKPSAISHIDETQAIINTINKQVILDKIQNDYLEKQIKIAENAKDYAKQIELQNQLLSNQQKTISDLKLANDQIHAQADLVRSKTKYNTESWFNADNSDTTSYIALLNSFEGKTDEASKKVVENIKNIHDKIKTLKDGWISNKDAIDNMNISLAQTSDVVEDLTRKAVETVAKMEDDIVKMWEDELENKLKDLKDWYDNKKDLANEDYKNEKRILEEQLDDFRKYIEEQKRILNRSFDEDKFNEELAEKQDQLAELQKKFNELSLSASSGDRVALSKQSDINKEITDKQKEIDDLVAERSKKIQEDALNDALSDYEDYMKNKQDALDKEHDSEIKAIERTYNRKVEKLKEEYDKEKLYSQARQMLISGEYSELTDLYEQYQKNQGEGWSELGGILEAEYLAKLREASSILSELDGKGISTGKLIKAIGGDSSNSSNSGKHADSNGNAPQGTKIGDVVHTAGNHAFKVVGYGDTRAITGGQYNPASGLTSIKLYDTGGEFKHGTGGINLSGKPEYILNPEQTEYLKVFLTKVPDMFSLSNLNVPKLSNDNIVNKPNVANAFQIDSLVTFNGDTSGLDISDVKTVVKNEFNNFAKQLNIGNINFNKRNVLI